MIVHGAKTLSKEMALAIGIYNRTLIESNMTFESPMDLIPYVKGFGFIPHAMELQERQESSWYGPYKVTISLIVLLHVIYLYQWNHRFTRTDTMVSYKQLVQQKRFYKAVVAFFSHPPADSPPGMGSSSSSTSTSSTGNNNNNNRTIDFGNADSQSLLQNNSSSTFLSSILPPNVRQYIKQCLHPFLYGHLSGFPLLMYNCHIFWACRALEPILAINPSSGSFARILITLLITGLAFELSMTSSLLKSTTRLASTLQHHYQQSQRLDSFQPSLGTQSQQSLLPLLRLRTVVLYRGMGTMTLLSSSLLLLHHITLPHVGTRILPLVAIITGQQRLSASSFLVSFSYWTSLFILIFLSWRFHALSSVLAGSLAAMLWYLGFTRFLSTPYWSNCLLAWIVGLCLLSLASVVSIPCIDFVSWDEQGVIQHEQSGRRNSQRHSSSSSGLGSNSQYEMMNWNNESSVLFGDTLDGVDRENNNVRNDEDEEEENSIIDLDSPRPMRYNPDAGTNRLPLDALDEEDDDEEQSLLLPSRLGRSSTSTGGMRTRRQYSNNNGTSPPSRS